MAEGERGFLGLTHNPFTQGDEGFFERGNRQTHLEQLRHPSQWTRRVLLVTGPDGVGKSVLYRKFSATLEPRAKAARINGSFINTSREILMSIAQGFGIAAPVDSNRQLLCDMIESHCADYHAQDRACLVMIDDAENLEPRAIDDLLTLVESSNLQTAFFGEVRLVSMVERVATRLALEWHEIRLTGFDEGHAREYLEWRFQQAKYRGRLPFTEEQVREIVLGSQGLPGKINQQANAALAKLEVGDSGKAGKRFPALHRAVVVLLVVILGFAYLLWRQSENAAQDALAERAIAQSAAQEAAKRAVQTVQEAIPRLPPASRPGVESVSAQPAESSAASTPDTAGSTELARADASTLSEASTTADVEPATAVERATTAQAIEAVAGPVPGVQASSLPQSLARDATWLMRQAGSAFTLQMLTVSSQQRAISFVNARLNPQRFALYRMQRNGRVLFVVVYGLFDSREEAQNIAASLPASFGNITPWPRPLRQIQDAIRPALQQ